MSLGAAMDFSSPGKRDTPANDGIVGCKNSASTPDKSSKRPAANNVSSELNMPYIVVAVVGKSSGKWKSMMESTAQRSAHARKKLHLELSRNGFTGDSTTDVDGYLIGFALMERWNLTPPAEMKGLDKLLISLVHTTYYKSDPVVCFHRIIDSVRLQSPVRLPQEPWKGNDLWIRCWMSPLMRLKSPAESNESLLGTSCITSWFNFTGARTVHEWQAWHPIAHCVCSKAISVEITLFVKKDNFGCWKPNFLQRETIMKHAASLKVQPNLTAPEPPVADFRGKKSAVKKQFSVPVKIKAVIASKHLKSVSNLSDSVQDSVALFDETQGSCTERERVATSLIPMKMTVLRSRIRLDVASMLLHRKWYASHGPVFRYVLYDASPLNRQSQELMNTSEIVITKSSLRGKRFETVNAESILRRRLPPSFLPLTGTNLVGKADAVLHQTWLEYGDSLEMLKNANRSVRIVVSDLGTELGIGNMWDCSKPFWEGRHLEAIGDEDKVGFLFPEAMVVPGPLHIIDWLIRETLAQIPFWGEMEKRMKTLQQFMHSQRVRNEMKRRINLKHPQCALDLLHSLDSSCSRFANWRWVTLHKSLEEQLAKEKAFKLAFQGEDLSTWSIHSLDIWQAVKFAMKSEHHWQQLRAIQKVIEPLMHFHFWIKGCPCHSHSEHDSSGSKMCPRQGQRCVGIASRLDMLLQELQQTADTLHDNDFCELIEIAPLRQALLACIGRTNMKFSWLRGMLYRIWQVHLLGTYDVFLYSFSTNSFYHFFQGTEFR